jgi:hypothetical protein
MLLAAGTPAAGAEELAEQHLVVMRGLLPDAAAGYHFSLEQESGNTSIPLSHWQQGLEWRREVTWLGFTTSTGFRPLTRWFHDSYGLPRFDTSLPAMPEPVIFGGYLMPGAGTLAATDLPQPAFATGYQLLVWSAPRCHEVLLLVEPDSLRLAGAAVGGRPELAASRWFKVHWLTDWREFGSATYPTVLQVEYWRDGVLCGHGTETRIAALAPGVDIRNLPSLDIAPNPELPETPYRLRLSRHYEQPVLALYTPEQEYLELLLDTGADITLLTSAVADYLGLSPGLTASIHGHGQQTTAGYVALDGYALYEPGYDVEIALPRFPAAVPTSANHFSMALDNSALNGIIGAQLLNWFAVEIDWPRREVWLHPADEYSVAAPPPGMSAHPVGYDNGRPHIMARIDGQEAGIWFNTGADCGLLLNPEWEGATGAGEATTGGITLGGAAELDSVVPPVITLGSHAFEPEVALLDTIHPEAPPRQNFAGELGLPFFEAYRVVFDLHGGVVYIAPY